nr:MAG TPA: hypothetical protein [Caudoviricetes sp.]
MPVFAKKVQNPLPRKRKMQYFAYLHAAGSPPFATYSSYSL